MLVPNPLAIDLVDVQLGVVDIHTTILTFRAIYQTALAVQQAAPGLYPQKVVVQNFKVAAIDSL